MEEERREKKKWRQVLARYWKEEQKMFEIEMIGDCIVYNIWLKKWEGQREEQHLCWMAVGWLVRNQDLVVLGYTQILPSPLGPLFGSNFGFGEGSITSYNSYTYYLIYLIKILYNFWYIYIYNFDIFIFLFLFYHIFNYYFILYNYII